MIKKRAVERAVEVKLGAKKAKFASLEDVVINKIIAEKDRDLEDTRTIFLKNHCYDAKFKKWSKEFDRSLSQKFLKVFQKLQKEVK